MVGNSPKTKNEGWWGINESVQHKILEINLTYLISIRNYKAQEPHVPVMNKNEWRSNWNKNE